MRETGLVVAFFTLVASCLFVVGYLLYDVVYRQWAAGNTGEALFALALGTMFASLFVGVMLAKK